MDGLKSLIAWAIGVWIAVGFVTCFALGKYIASP